jgi:lambda family phage minor tail protein L
VSDPFTIGESPIGGPAPIGGEGDVVDSQLVTHGLITLFQLDTRPINPVAGQVFYFTSAEDFETVIIWGGQQYTALPMDATGFEMTTRGTIPQPSVTISNIFGAGNLLLDTYNGLLGALVTRILTLRRFLDDGSTPDPAAYITRDQFVVAQKMSHNAVAIVFKLAAKIDQEGTQLPRRLILRDICTHTYRFWNPNTGAFDYSKASCPYTGSFYSDINNTPCGPPQDQCSRSIAGCSQRFGGGVLPARFFPGVGRVK